MDAKEYIENRLDHQIEWYSRQSQSAQWWHKSLRLVEFFCAALIPFLAGIVTEETGYLKVAIGLLGVVVAAITAAQGLYQWNEHWIQYRTTCEALKKEKFLFLTEAEPYGKDERELSTVGATG